MAIDWFKLVCKFSELFNITIATIAGNIMLWMVVLVIAKDVPQIIWYGIFFSTVSIIALATEIQRVITKKKISNRIIDEETIKEMENANQE